jgi:pyruvyl transferase EpsO
MKDVCVTTAVDKIRRETSDILRAEIRGDRVAVLDYPNHFNSGDLLIYRGQLQYLERLGIEAAYVCATHTYDPAALARYLPAGPLLLQGGGNFGDRYDRFQLFRERVIAENPDRTIIQMPQTIDFLDKAALARAQAVYSRHRDLTLMIRDKAGCELTRSLFPDNRVVYCPDLAFGADQLPATKAPTRDIVMLKRRDQESVHNKDDAGRAFPGVPRTEWHASVADNFKWWPMSLANSALHKVPGVRVRAYPYARWAFDRQCDLIIRNAVDILSEGRVVVTDRLHAAVFSVLLGKPVVMVDNANKKLSAIYRDYLGSTPGTYLADDFDDAAQTVESLL